MDRGTLQTSEVEGKTDTKSRHMRVGFLKSVLVAFGSPEGAASRRLPFANKCGSGRVSQLFRFPMPQKTARSAGALPGSFALGRRPASRRKRVEEGLQVFSEDDGPGANLARGQLALTDQLENLGPANAGRLADVLNGQADLVIHGVHLRPDWAGCAAHQGDAQELR